MRLGGQVYRWSTAREWAERHIEKGYGAALWPLGMDASPLDEADFVSEARRVGLVIAEVGIWRNVFDRDPRRAEENIQYSIARMKLADRVGARCCVNISGSLSDFWDGPHPDNLTPATFDRIVKVTQRMMDEARLAVSDYSLEPMPWMYPTDVATTRALLEAVDRPRFGVHVDMVNMINSPEKVYRTGELTKAYFGAFRDRIRSVHVKDLTIRTDLTVCMPEVVCGEGVFDLRTLLRECAGFEDMPMIVEHLPDEATYDRAVAHLRGLADGLGLRFDAAH